MVFSPDAKSGSRSIGLTTILLLASRELARLNVDAIEVCTHEKPALRWIGPLRRLHPRRRDARHGQVQPQRPRLAASNMLQTENWQLRPADGDNMF